MDRKWWWIDEEAVDDKDDIFGRVPIHLLVDLEFILFNMDNRNRMHKRAFLHDFSECDENMDSVSIRTLYVAPIKQHIIDQIGGYFGQFGEIESIHLQRFNNNFQYAFIQFKMASVANAVLLTSRHRIENCYVKVKIADLWHQSDFVLQMQQKSIEPPPPANDSPLNILNALNDDCLREILKRLILPDLSNVADVCNRFDYLAKQIFASKYKYETISFHSELSGRFADVKAMLRNFGPFIRSLSICYTIEVIDCYGISLRMINQHCSALKELDVSHFRFTGDWKRLCPMFANLTLLALDNCGLTSNHKGLFAACAKLKVLRFSYCYWIDKCIGQTFPNIEEAYFHTNWVNNTTFVKFITQNPTLRKLSFVGNRLMTTDLIHLIGQRLVELQEFEFNEIAHNLEQYQYNMLYLSQLRSLKVLKLNFNSLSVVPLMEMLIENQIPIEHLKLINAHIDTDAVHSVAQLSRITILELCDVHGLTDKHLTDLAKRLTQLQELHFYDIKSHLSTKGLKKILAHAHQLTFLKLNSVHGIFIDMDDYQTILKTVRNRNGLNQLTLEIISDETKVKVPDEILMLNKKWIRINETVLYHYLSDNSSEESDGISDDEWWQ